MKRLDNIEQKLAENRELSRDEGIFLATTAPSEWLQQQAELRRTALHGDVVWYNRNIHFEPTNLCLYSCRFCAFYRPPGTVSEGGAWEWGSDELLELLRRHPPGSLTEVHITGGVHPDRRLDWALELIATVRAVRPELHIKAFTAVEIDYFARSSSLSVAETLQSLRAAGLDSLPGGGAEIFAHEVRRVIAGGKSPAHRWLEVHREAHRLGIPSNATMLYGHVENWEHRIDHLIMLRELQKEYEGFNAMIPLRYRNGNNRLSSLPEISSDEERRIFALSRLMLHNIPHLKAYWVMAGFERALHLLSWGADDLDGTIADTTQIYSMAGEKEKPDREASEMETMIRSIGRSPRERDSLYQPVIRSLRSSEAPICF